MFFLQYVCVTGLAFSTLSVKPVSSTTSLAVAVNAAPSLQASRYCVAKRNTPTDEKQDDHQETLGHHFRKCDTQLFLIF